MSSFGSIGDPSLASTVFVKAADPGILQDLVNAEIGKVGGSSVITAITLAGSGDGHTFVAIIETAPSASTTGGLVGGAGAAVTCYMGSSPEELARSKSAAGVPAPFSNVPYALVDEQLAGGAKGQVFMGLSLFSLSSVPGAANSPRVRGLITVTKVLAGGNNVLSFDSLDGANQFTLPAPQTIRYTGKQAIVAQLDASVTVEQTGAGDVTVQIVEDPNGAATVLASTLTHVAAGEFDNVSVFGFDGLEPSVPTELGLRVVAAGAGEVTSATLRISQA
jgi:hypothetical protein